MRKIIIAVDTYFPKKDGVVRFLENIIPLLAKDFFITILAPDFDSNGRFINTKNVNEILFPIDKRKSFAGYSAVKKTKKLDSVVRREIRNCDIVFSQDIAYLGRLSVKYGKDFRKPVTAYIHQIAWEQIEGILADKPLRKWFWRWIAKRISRKIYNSCSLLLVPSKKTAVSLKNEGITKEKAIIRLGVDTEKFSPPDNKSAAKIKVNIKPDKLVIGYCGRISEEKDLITLKNAFVKVKERFPNAMLLLVGDGTEEYVRKIKEDSKDIRITGFTTNVSGYLKAMDIFVLPSLTETTSLATLEAMASGIPAITTSVGRLQEYIEHGVNGYLFQKSNEEVLAQRIETLAEDEKKRELFGKNARETITKFSWNLPVQQMKELFEKLNGQT